MKKAAVVTIAFFVLVFSVSAQDGTWCIDSLDVSIELGRNAVCAVKENYVMDYFTSHHGFYRYIPVEFDNRNVHIKNVRCSDGFEEEKADGFEIIKIGKASKTLKGLNECLLTYDMDIGADLNAGYDEFQVNLIGDGWDVPARRLDFSVIVPCSASEILFASLSRGQYGSVAQSPFEVAEIDGRCVVSGSATNLKAGEAVTLTLQFADNWYVGARRNIDLRGLFRALCFVLSPCLAVASWLIWNACGRDDVPVVLASANAPDGMSPLMTGYIVDGCVDDRDIVSMVLYWADQGLLRIEEAKKNRFSYTKLKDISSDAPEFEKKLFCGFFKGGNTVNADILTKSGFAQTYSGAKLEVPLYFRKERSLVSSKSVALSALFAFVSAVPIALLAAAYGAYELAPDVFALPAIIGMFGCAVNFLMFKTFFARKYVRKSDIPFVLIICALYVLFFMILSGIYSAIAFEPFNHTVLPVGISVVSSAVISLTASIMPKRSSYGKSVFEKVLGLREYINKVSVDEIKLMADSDPEFYYHVLSYAVSLGLAEKWAKKFSGINVPVPSWYGGCSVADRMFYTSMTNRMIPHMGSMLRSAAVPPQVSSGRGGHAGISSGFGHGGFAGGGFGGGGGRGW